MPHVMTGRRKRMKGRAGSHPVWSRDFGLFFVARAVAQLGDTMLPVALAAGLLQHGYGAGAVGLALAATSAAFAGLIVFGGVIADRFSTRKLMIGADLVRLGTQSLAAVLFFTGHVVLWQICAIGFVNGAAGAVFQPGVAAQCPGSPPTSRARTAPYASPRPWPNSPDRPSRVCSSVLRHPAACSRPTRPRTR